MRLSTVERQQLFGENMDFKDKFSKESPEDRERRIREELSVYTDEELEKEIKERKLQKQSKKC